MRNLDPNYFYIISLLRGMFRKHQTIVQPLQAPGQ